MDIDRGILGLDFCIKEEWEEGGGDGRWGRGLDGRHESSICDVASKTKRHLNRFISETVAKAIHVWRNL